MAQNWVWHWIMLSHTSIVKAFRHNIATRRAKRSCHDLTKKPKYSVIKIWKYFYSSLQHSVFLCIYLLKLSWPSGTQLSDTGHCKKWYLSEWVVLWNKACTLKTWLCDWQNRIQDFSVCSSFIARVWVRHFYFKHRLIFSVNSLQGAYHHRHSETPTNPFHLMPVMSSGSCTGKLHHQMVVLDQIFNSKTERIKQRSWNGKWECCKWDIFPFWLCAPGHI